MLQLLPGFVIGHARSHHKHEVGISWTNHGSQPAECVSHNLRSRQEFLVGQIRHISIKHFRGFDELSIPVSPRLLLVGEPGAGRSDLIEALVRVLDPDYRRSRRSDEFDFHNLETSVPVEVVLAIGGLGDTSASPLLPRVEFWDADDQSVVHQTGDPAATMGLEEIVRIGYWLAARADGSLDERVFWAKAWTSGEEPTQWVSQAEQRLFGFLWQRGIESRPLDLGQRGDLRRLIEQQPGEDFEEAVERFLQEVEDAAESFSGQERVAAALEEVYRPLRGVRRFRDGGPAADLIRFLPDGGAKSGLLRSLVAAITLEQGPEHLPAFRHGTTALTALRAGLLIYGARSQAGTIVALDEIGADVDPFLGRHIVDALRNTEAQIVVASRAPQIVDAFAPEEITRLYWSGGERRAARGRDLSTRTDRIALRFRASQLAPAMSARAVVVVDGYHDRLALQALATRSGALGQLPSYAAAGIAFTDADGTGGLRDLAGSARSLGIYTVVVADNDSAAGAPDPPELAGIASSSDIVIRLPARTALELLLISDVPDDELRRVVALLAGQFPSIRTPVDVGSATERELRDGVVAMLKQPGPLHVSLVNSLDERWLCPAAVRVLGEIHRLVQAREPQRLIRLDGLAATDIAAAFAPTA